MSIAKDVAQAIVKSGLWGDANPNTVLMLCYLAEAEGNHPAVVYRDYHIMSGKPSKKAEAILRDFVAAGGKIEWHTLDDNMADATFSHASGSARITWDMNRARAANLKSPMWSKYPRQMLRSRCISEGVRTVYPGATSGLYEESEVADIVADEGRNTPPMADEGQSQGSDQGAVSPPASEMPDAEWARLVQLIETTSANIPAMLKHLKISLPDDNLKLLTQQQYSLVIDALNDKLAKMARDETTERAKENA